MQKRVRSASDVDFEDSGTDDEWLEPDESDMDVRPSIRALTHENVLVMTEDYVARLQEVTGLDPDDAWAMLTQRKWNIEDCMIAYSEDPTKALNEALGHPTKEIAAAAASAEKCCCVCFESSCDLLDVLPCGHAACRDCWATYIATQVQTSRSCRITCLGEGCTRIVPRSRVEALLKDRDLRSFRRFVVDSHLQNKKNMTWCPTPNCGVILVAENASVSQLGVVRCTECLEQFCFRCGENHAPATCQMMREFNKRAASEGNDVLWLTKHTKECPQCACFIEKNGGCNWLKCYKCGFEFCWLCGRNITHREIDAAGGSHKCNAFKDGEDAEISAREKKKNAMKEKDDRKRFIHYHGRWLAHRESNKIEQKKLSSTEHHDNETEDVRALRKAQSASFTQLRVARETLWSSYIFAHYNQWDQTTSGKEIFEDLQNLLENRTEMLSKTIEASIRNTDLTRDINAERLELIRLFDAVKANMKNLIDACNRDTT